MTDPYAPPPSSPSQPSPGTPVEVVRAPAPLPSQLSPYTADGSVPAPSPYSTYGSVPPPTAYGTPVVGSGATPPPDPYRSAPYESSPSRAYGTPPPPGTDGVSIAALVTGVLGLGLVPLVLGIVGLQRTGRTRQGGRRLAIAGIVLGAVQIVLGAAAIIALVIAGTRGAFGPVDTSVEPGIPGMYELGMQYGDNARLDAFWDSCEAGDMQACDSLFVLSEAGSDYEWFGDTCGARVEDAAFCSGRTFID